MKRKVRVALFVALVLMAAACQHSQEPVVPGVTPPVVTLPDSSYRIEQIILSPGRTITFQYDSLGRVAQSTLSDSLKNSYTIIAKNWNFVYDASGHLQKLAGEDDHTITVSTDTSGYITQAVRVLFGNFVFQTSMSYDSVHQMTKFKYLTMGGGQTYSFAYNPDGNLTYADRSGTPANLNFSLQATTYDNQKSLWQANLQNHYIYWWLMCVTYSADQSPALFLSYQHNVTHAIYSALSGQQDTLTVRYDYKKELPVSIKSIRADSSLFRGPYQIVYQSYVKGKK